MLSNTVFIFRAVSFADKKKTVQVSFFSFSGETQSIEKSICYEASEQIWDGKSGKILEELRSFCVVMELKF